MADESIGSVSVAITGDPSDLKAALEAAVQSAQQSGTDIAAAIAKAYEGGASNLQEALNQIASSANQAASATGPMADSFSSAGEAASAAAGQLSLFSEAANVPYSEATGQLNMFATELEPIGGAAAAAATGVESLSGAASAAAQPVHNLGEETHGAGEHAHEAESAFAQMAEKLLMLGEALAITEALKEFGSEALHAADNVTRASIALTTITGDGDKAKETIEGLEKLGIQDGLSFPSLLTAGTRMQNILGPGADVAKLLGEIANGAAVMGTDIGSAANAFDRMAGQGVVSQRSLTPLGLTIGDLSKALGVTTAEAVKAFKAIGDGMAPEEQVSARTAVLEQALSRLGGTAEKVASQTFGGQWQILVNQWDGLMVTAGQALMPVITGITSFIKLDVMPFLKGLADGFTALPTPVKDVAVVLGVALAAIAPLTLAVGGFGLAVSAAAEVLPMISGALGTVGFSAAAAATEETAAAVATTELGTASATAAGEQGVGGLGSALKVLGPAAIIAAGAFAAFKLGDFGGEWDRLKFQISETTDKFGEMWDSLKQGAITAIPNASDAMVVLRNQFPEVVGSIDKLDESFKKTKASMFTWTQAMEALTGGFGAAFQVISDTANLLEKWSGTSLKASQNTEQLEKTAVILNAALAQHGITIEKGTSTLEQWVQKMAAASVEVGKSEVAAKGAKQAVGEHTAALEAQIPVVTNVHHATKDFVDISTLALGPMAQETIQLEANTQKFAALGMSVVHAKEELAAAYQAYETSKARADAMGVSIEAVSTTALPNLTKALQAAKTATDQFNAAAAPLMGTPPVPGSIFTPEAAATMNEAAIAIGKMGTSASNLGPYVQTAASDFRDMGLALKDVDDYDQTMIDGFLHFAKNVEDDGFKVDELKAAWKATRGEIDALAHSDLPAAEAAYRTYIQALKDAGAPMHSILDAQTQMLTMERDLAFARGDDWGKYQLALDIAIQKQIALHDSSIALATAYKDVMKAVDETFRALSTDIATAIVDGKNLGEELVKSFQKIAKSILEDVINGALSPLKSALKDLIGQGFTALSGAISGGLSGISGLAQASTAAAAAGMEAQHAAVMAAAGFTQAGTAATTTATSMTTAGSSVSSAFGSVGGAINVVSGAISAVTGVIGLFQNAAMASTMKLVELNTRISAIVESKELPLSNQISVEQEGTLHDISTHTAPIPDIAAHTFWIGQLLEHISNVGIVGLAGGISATATATEQLVPVTQSIDATGRESGKAILDAVHAAHETVNQLQEIEGVFRANADAALARGDLNTAALLTAQADAVSAQIAAIQQSALYGVDNIRAALYAERDALVAVADAAMARGDLNTAAIIGAQINGINQQLAAATTVDASINRTRTEVSVAVANSGERTRGAVISSVDQQVKAINDTAAAQIETLRTQEADLKAKQQEAIDAGHKDTADLIQRVIDEAEKQIAAIEKGAAEQIAVVSGITTALAQEGVLGRNAIGDGTQAVGIAVTNGAERIRSGVSETTAAVQTIPPAIQQASQSGLTAMFGARDTIIAALQAQKDAYDAIGKAALARGDLNTSNQMAAYAQGVQGQIDALKTGVSTLVTAVKTADPTPAVNAGAAGIVTAVTHTGTTISAATSAAIITAQQANAAAFGQVSAQISAGLGQVSGAIAAVGAAIIGLPSGGTTTSTAATYSQSLVDAGYNAYTGKTTGPAYTNQKTGGISGAEGYGGSAGQSPAGFWNALEGGPPSWYKDAASMARNAGISLPVNVQQGAGGKAFVLYVNPDGTIGSSNAQMQYTAGDPSFRAPGLDDWTSRVAALGFDAFAAQAAANYAGNVADAKTGFDTAVPGIGKAGLPGFASGIDIVPYDMTANIHQGEKIIPSGPASDMATATAQQVQLGQAMILAATAAKQLQAQMDAAANLDDLKKATDIQIALGKAMQIASAAAIAAQAAADKNQLDLAAKIASDAAAQLQIQMDAAARLAELNKAMDAQSAFAAQQVALQQAASDHLAELNDAMDAQQRAANLIELNTAMDAQQAAAGTLATKTSNTSLAELNLAMDAQEAYASKQVALETAANAQLVQLNLAMDLQQKFADSQTKAIIGAFSTIPAFSGALPIPTQPVGGTATVGPYSTTPGFAGALPIPTQKIVDDGLTAFWGQMAAGGALGPSNPPILKPPSGATNETTTYGFGADAAALSANLALLQGTMDAPKLAANLALLQGTMDAPKLAANLALLQQTMDLPKLTENALMLQATFPSFDSGGNIPYDGNYRLQAGEVVIPANSAPGAGSGGNWGISGPVTINVNGAQDPAAVVREIDRYLKRLSPQFQARHA